MGKARRKLPGPFGFDNSSLSISVGLIWGPTSTHLRSLANTVSLISVILFQSLRAAVVQLQHVMCSRLVLMQMETFFMLKLLVSFSPWFCSTRTYGTSAICACAFVLAIYFAQRKSWWLLTSRITLKRECFNFIHGKSLISCPLDLVSNVISFDIHVYTPTLKP